MKSDLLRNFHCKSNTSLASSSALYYLRSSEKLLNIFNSYFSILNSQSNTLKSWRNGPEERFCYVGSQSNPLDSGDLQPHYWVTEPGATRSPSVTAATWGKGLKVLAGNPALLIQRWEHLYWQNYIYLFKSKKLLKERCLLGLWGLPGVPPIPF